MFRFYFMNIPNIFFSLITCSIHKNPLQNTGIGIQDTLFKISQGSMPPNPIEVLANLADPCLPHKNL